MLARDWSMWQPKRVPHVTLTSSLTWSTVNVDPVNGGPTGLVGPMARSVPWGAHVASGLSDVARRVAARAGGGDGARRASEAGMECAHTGDGKRGSTERRLVQLRGAALCVRGHEAAPGRGKANKGAVYGGVSTLLLLLAKLR